MKKTVLTILTIVLTIMLVGCVNTTATTYAIGDIQDDIAIVYASGDDQYHVTQDLTLPTVSSLDDEATITWVSDQPDIISHAGNVTRPATDQSVILVYTIAYHDETMLDSITVTVIAKPLTIEDILADIQIIFADGDDASHVTRDITLPSVSSLDDSVIIAWSSSDPSIVSHGGVVTRGDKDFAMFMQYTVVFNNELEHGFIPLTVIAKEVYYTVTFATNGGTSIEDVTVLKNDTIVQPEDPVRESYTFEGWYTDSYYTTIYDFSTEVTADFTLYALWEIDSYIDYSGVYDGAEELTGTALLSFLYEVTTDGFINRSYEYVKTSVPQSDVDPNNHSKVLTIYDRSSVKGSWTSGGTVWNREHIWPSSKLDGANYSDLFNLRPAVPSINSSRGNDSFVDKPGGGTYGTYGNGWYPGDEDCGDVARAIFYMIVRYGLNVNVVGNMNTFLKWNEQDPVDSFEANRNDVITSLQGTPNPFVDHPEFADYIWGEY